MPRLYVLSGPDLGATHDFEGTVVVGRAAPADIVVRARTISRKHARIERLEEGWAIEDLGSANGTFVADQRVTEAWLTSGESFRLGDVELRFRAEEAAAGPAPAEEAEEPPDEPLIEGLELDLGDDLSGDEGDGELELEGDWDDSAPAPAAPEPLAPEAASLAAAPRATRTARRAAAARAEALGGGVAQRPKGAGKVLAHHRVEQREGLLNAEVNQHPELVRWLLYLLLVALFVGLGYGAYSLTTGMKSARSGDEPVDVR